jgi:ubiquinone/menaquinone biosynthesis C-methylase UbiE
MNYFAYKSAAERYAKGRPYFHPQIISRVSTYLSLVQPVSRAIDVGCGTGLSSVALQAVAQSVVGVDISAEMITLARSLPDLTYIVAPAERLPLIADAFDLMTVSQAFHWLGRTEFLTEARRVLHTQGWLIVYDNYFSGQMEENREFERWVEEYYQKEYPSPPRAPVNFGIEEAEREGFQFTHQETFPNSTQFSLQGLVNYLMTHTNVIATIEAGNKHAVEVRDSLTKEIAPYFGNRMESSVRFNAPIWYLRKLAP